jgi:D-inositol-3-phosphate glycosyltransferase
MLKDRYNDLPSARGPNSVAPPTVNEISVSLLTGGDDKPYVFGLVTACLPMGAVFDLIGSNDLDCPEFRNRPGVNFINLRGDQRPDASFLEKSLRITKYYAKLIRYAVTAKPKIFHILWNNRFEVVDRTLLMFYYRLVGKRIVLTAHNVNSGKRDSRDTFLNRVSLRIQYRLSDHIFVHTEKMKLELIGEYGVQQSRISVIPFGINNSVPHTSLTSSQARERLSIDGREKTILFFGNITPYKGLEYLIAAFRQLLTLHRDYKLLVVGNPGKLDKYWASIREAILDIGNERLLLRDEFIPDDQTELYFKAADVLVLPYKQIYQSGVLFLGHSFGLPVIAADVGCLKDEIIDGQTGYLFKPEDADDLAKVIERYFASDLYADLNRRRPQIRDYATVQHSWDLVSQITLSIYADLVETPSRGEERIERFTAQ